MPRRFPLPAFDHVELRLRLEARQGGPLPPYLGSTLRGALAWSLRRMFCSRRAPRYCRDCALKHSCWYAYLFETPRPPDAQGFGTLEEVPHPLLIIPQSHGGAYGVGEELEFSVRLFGRAGQAALFVAEAARQAARDGLGYRKIPFHLVSIRDASPRGRSLYQEGGFPQDFRPRPKKLRVGRAPARERLAVELVTPLRLVERGQLVLRPTFRSLVRAALFRLRAMAYFHYGMTIPVDAPSFLNQAESVELSEARTALTDLERYSNRQKRRIPLNAITGRLVYQGEFKPFWPVLRAAELLHIGKGTVFGLGAIRCCAKDG